jgi:hypothetical protein
MVRVEEGSSEWLTPYNCIEAAAGPTDSGSVLRTTVKSADEVRYDSRAGGGAISAWTSDPAGGSEMCGKCVVQSIECIRDCAIFGDKGKQAGEQKRLIVAESVEKHRE